MEKYEIPEWVRTRITEMFLNTDSGTLSIDAVVSRDQLIARLENASSMLHGMAVSLESIAMELRTDE